MGEQTSAAQLARQWTEAYIAGQDEELVRLAHPEMELRPRRGQGRTVYRGPDGVRRWLADASGSRPPLDFVTIEPLPDGRAIGEARIDGVDVVTVFEARDGLIARAAVYLSDRRTLESVGVVPRVQRAPS